MNSQSEVRTGDLNWNVCGVFRSDKTWKGYKRTQIVEVLCIHLVLHGISRGLMFDNNCHGTSVRSQKTEIEVW